MLRRPLKTYLRKQKNSQTTVVPSRIVKTPFLIDSDLSDNETVDNNKDKTNPFESTFDRIAKDVKLPPPPSLPGPDESLYDVSSSFERHSDSDGLDNIPFLKPAVSPLKKGTKRKKKIGKNSGINAKKSRRNFKTKINTDNDDSNDDDDGWLKKSTGKQKENKKTQKNVKKKIDLKKPVNMETESFNNFNFPGGDELKVCSIELIRLDHTSLRGKNVSNAEKTKETCTDFRINLSGESDDPDGGKKSSINLEKNQVNVPIDDDDDDDDENLPEVNNESPTEAENSVVPPSIFVDKTNNGTLFEDKKIRDCYVDLVPLKPQSLEKKQSLAKSIPKDNENIDTNVSKTFNDISFSKVNTNSRITLRKDCQVSLTRLDKIPKTLKTKKNKFLNINLNNQSLMSSTPVNARIKRRQTRPVFSPIDKTKVDVNYFDTLKVVDDKSLQVRAPDKEKTDKDDDDDDDNEPTVLLSPIYKEKEKAVPPVEEISTIILEDSKREEKNQEDTVDGTSLVNSVQEESNDTSNVKINISPIKTRARKLSVEENNDINKNSIKKSNKLLSMSADEEARSPLLFDDTNDGSYDKDTKESFSLLSSTGSMEPLKMPSSPEKGNVNGTVEKNSEEEEEEISQEAGIEDSEATKDGDFTGCSLDNDEEVMEGGEKSVNDLTEEEISCENGDISEMVGVNDGNMETDNVEFDEKEESKEASSQGEADDNEEEEEEEENTNEETEQEDDEDEDNATELGEVENDDEEKEEEETIDESLSPEKEKKSEKDEEDEPMSLDEDQNSQNEENDELMSLDDSQENNVLLTTNDTLDDSQEVSTQNDDSSAINDSQESRDNTAESYVSRNNTADSLQSENSQQLSDESSNSSTVSGNISELSEESQDLSIQQDIVTKKSMENFENSQSTMKDSEKSIKNTEESIDDSIKNTKKSIKKIKKSIKSTKKSIKNIEESTKNTENSMDYSGSTTQNSPAKINNTDCSLMSETFQNLSLEKKDEISTMETDDDNNISIEIKKTSCAQKKSINFITDKKIIPRKSLKLPEPYILLTRLNDPLRISNRKRDYSRSKKFDLSAISEGVNKDDEKENSKTDKIEENNEKENVNGLVPIKEAKDDDEFLQDLDDEPNNDSSVLYLKPGKQWTRSLSILNQFNNNRNFNMSTPGKGKKWRQSVIDVHNMQHGTIKKLSSTDFNESINSQDESMELNNNPPRFTGVSSRRVTYRQSKINSESQNSEVDEKLSNICRRKTSVIAPRRTTIYHPRVTNIHTNAIVPNSPEEARNIVFQRCKQDDCLPIAACYNDKYLKHCVKIGEGVYGEVFLYKNKTESSVIKIIPIEGSQLVNGEPQKKFNEILSEIIIAEELHNLRFNEKYKTSGFVELKSVKCLVGKYPKKLLQLWDKYDDEKKSENDSPSMFADDQMYIALELGNGGQDLEAFVFQNASEAYSTFIQIALTLAVGEKALNFEHRDMHWGNILIGKTKEKTIFYQLDDEEIHYSCQGIKVSIIDFTLSRITYQGCCMYNDLALDPALFTAVGEYQFDIYRLMKARVKNDWKKYEPSTNIFWLHYTLDKMITAVRYNRVNTKIHKKGIEKLEALKEDILQYDSAHHFIMECDLIPEMKRSKIKST